MAAESGVTWGSASYPVNVDVEPEYDNRNRLTTFFRLILAIPHAILVGGPGVSMGFLFWRGGWGDREWGQPWGWAGGEGLLGAVAFIGAVIAWFAIIFATTHPRGLWDLANFYMRWRVRAVSYMALFRDEYPPFGDAAYPAAFGCPPPEDAQRDKLSVGLRFLYVIPHLVVLFFLGIAWAVTTIIAWFAILFTGSYPRGMYEFGLGVMRWSIRVEAYALLMRDEYPPFSLQP